VPSPEALQQARREAPRWRRGVGISGLLRLRETVVACPVAGCGYTEVHDLGYSIWSQGLAAEGKREKANLRAAMKIDHPRFHRNLT
jgi:hypothetical protein